MVGLRGIVNTGITIILLCNRLHSAMHENQRRLNLFTVDPSEDVFKMSICVECVLCVVCCVVCVCVVLRGVCCGVLSC